MNEAYNIDCMEFMRRVPSKYFDLAVVDLSLIHISEPTRP